MDIEEKLKIIEEHFKNLPVEEFEKFLEKNLYVYCINCLHFKLDDKDLPCCIYEDECKEK
jgi:hypothetical protein